MISLFDYLNEPAGLELGKQVNNYARLRKTPHSIREVKTERYNGKVMLYPKEFLDEFFKVKEIFQPQSETTKKVEFPF